MKASKKATLISYILQAVMFITIMVLIFTLPPVKMAPLNVLFVFINGVCLTVMHHVFMREVREYSSEIYNKLYTEYPYINHFKYLCYAFSATEEDKLTKNLLKLHYLFFVTFIVEMGIFVICNALL